MEGYPTEDYPERDYSDMDEADLLALYADTTRRMQATEARHWAEVRRLQEVVYAAHYELQRRDLWPFGDTS